MASEVQDFEAHLYHPTDCCCAICLAVREWVEENEKLRCEIDRLNHTIKVKELEITSRSAANKHLKQIIADLTGDGESTDDFD